MTTTAWDKLGVWVLRPRVFIVFALLQALLILFVDKPLAEFLNAQHLAQHFPWLLELTDLGKSEWYLVGLLLLALVYRWGFKNKSVEVRVWLLWFFLLISNSMCLLLKVVLGRARPQLWFSEHFYGFYGLHLSSNYWSFPSGHTTTITACAIGTAWLFPRYGWPLCVLAIMVVISRVVLLQHYLTDVIMAAGLVLVEISILNQWMKKNSALGAWGVMREQTK